MTPDRAELVALAARDVCRALAVLATLRDGPASNAELRRAAGWPGDSFRSLLRRMERAGLIVAIPSPRWRWALASKTQICVLNVDRLAARMPPAARIDSRPGFLPV